MNIHGGLKKWARASILCQRTDAWLSQKNKYLELKDVF